MVEYTGEQVRSDYHAVVREEVLELVPSGCKRVLDLGGGIGASAAFLKATGKVAEATVVDLIGDKCLPEIDHAYACDLEDLELLKKISDEAGPFDLILCLDVLEHLRDPWSVVDCLADLLEPGGVIVSSIPNVRNYELLVPLLFKAQFELTDIGILDRTHLRWFVGDTAKELMSRNGLRVDAFKKHFSGTNRTLFSKLTLGLFNDFLTIQFYIRSVKDV